MIVFDLACAEAHVFEAWFGSSEDYEGQRARGLVACPICGSPEVTKAVMAPNVGAKGNQLVPQAPAKPVPMMAGNAPAPAEIKQMLSKLAEMQAKALEKSEDVGGRFATEARAIHDGDAPDRLIHGQATIADVKSLIEDGIGVMPLPLPIVPPKQLQ
ncbi:hypothetical protein FHS31_001375 [Sphingomonas vulcanisoli]|uniref:DUF1178 family protein n=1 Tax=Sphingomonas vulcanisoli TaxID=1658060 RepID=A0ABX0TVG6_9SPHN|nr:DUF1178 family protein [Sphingomonas vulcanisoli]NIJ07765.1 hypothetical protein [Sphingomonas vulcanisoli]